MVDAQSDEIGFNPETIPRDVMNQLVKMQTELLNSRRQLKRGNNTDRLTIVRLRVRDQRNQ